MANIVTGGLGQPAEGALVTGGLGTNTPGSGPTYVNAYLDVTAASDTTIHVTATADAYLDVEAAADITIVADTIGTPTTDPPPASGGVTFRPRRLVRRYVDAELRVEASAEVSIEAIATPNFDAELEQLLLVGAI